MTDFTPEQRRGAAEASVEAVAVLRAWYVGDPLRADEVLQASEDPAALCRSMTIYALGAISAMCNHRGTDLGRYLDQMLQDSVTTRDEAEAAVRATPNQEDPTS